MLAASVALVAAPAEAQTQTPPVVPMPTSPKPVEGDCALPTQTLDGLCERANDVGAVVTNPVGTVAAAGGDALLAVVVAFVVDGAAWLVGQVGMAIHSGTRPDVTAAWFAGSYGDIAAIATAAVLPFFLFAVLSAVIRQSGAALGRAVAGLAVSGLGAGAALVVVDLLVGMTDDLSGWVLRAFGVDMTAFTTAMGQLLVQMIGMEVAGFGALLLSGAVAFMGLVVWIELVLRNAAVYVATLFLPLGFAAVVWPATAHWLRRLAQGLIAIIFSKLIIVAVLALGATALGSSVGVGGVPLAAAGGDDGAEAGVATVVVGLAMLLLAALAPYVLLRLIPVWEADLSSQLEGTLRRPTAATGAGPVMRHTVSRMLIQRINSTGQPGPAPPAAGPMPPLAYGWSAAAGTAGAATGGPDAAGSTGDQLASSAHAAASAGSPLQQRGERLAGNPLGSRDAQRQELSPSSRSDRETRDGGGRS